MNSKYPKEKQKKYKPLQRQLHFDDEVWSYQIINDVVTATPVFRKLRRDFLFNLLIIYHYLFSDYISIHLKQTDKQLVITNFFDIIAIYNPLDIFLKLKGFRR